MTGDLKLVPRLWRELVATVDDRDPGPTVSRGVVEARRRQCLRAVVQQAGNHLVRRSAT